MTGQKEKYDLRIEYDGQPHQIETNTLLNSLVNITGALNLINEELTKSTSVKRKLTINVNAFTGGSFHVHLELSGEILADALSIIGLTGKAEHLPTLIKIFVNYLKLKYLLGGEKPDTVTKTGENVTVVKNNNSVIVNNTVYNIYSKNISVSDAVKSNFDTLREDQSIAALNIVSQDKDASISIQRVDFGRLSTKNMLIEENERVDVDKDAALTILRLAFEENYKWQFYYRGIKIAATLTCSPFRNKIDSGEKFGKGDVLMCELEIHKVFDEEANTFADKSYNIRKVNDHIPLERQTGLQL